MEISEEEDEEEEDEGGTAKMPIAEARAMRTATNPRATMAWRWSLSQRKRVLVPMQLIIGNASAALSLTRAAG